MNYFQAHVVCRQLGYIRADAALTAITSPSDSFAFDGVYCDGTESSINECRYNTHDDCGTRYVEILDSKTQFLLAFWFCFEELFSIEIRQIDNNNGT